MNTKKFAFLNAILTCVILLSLFSGYATANGLISSAPGKNADISLVENNGSRKGYLEANEHPDSLVLLPPPPVPGSAAFALDEDIARRTFAVRGTPRFAQALSDYDMFFQHTASTFSCALNAPVTERDTPLLYKLLHRTLID